MNLIEQMCLVQAPEIYLTCRQGSATGDLLGVYASVEDAADDMLIDRESVDAALAEGDRQTADSPRFWRMERIVTMRPPSQTSTAAPSADPAVRTHTAGFLSVPSRPHPTSIPSRGRGGHSHPETSVPVVQLERGTLAFVARYRSIYEATASTGANNIPKCCRREAKSSGGYVWMYASDYDRLTSH